MLTLLRTTVAVIGIVGSAFCVSGMAVAQCSGSRGGGGGTGSQTGSTGLPNASQLPYTSLPLNNASYQRELGMRQQMQAMYNQMLMQQRQLIAMRQQLLQQQSERQYAQQRELLTARQDRAHAKEAEKTDRIAALKAKRSAVAARAATSDGSTTPDQLIQTQHGETRLTSLATLGSL